MIQEAGRYNVFLFHSLRVRLHVQVQCSEGLFIRELIRLYNL